MSNLKKGAAQVLFKGGLHLIPHMSDQSFLSLFEGKLREIPQPDGRDFMRQLFLATKRALSSPQTRKAATRLLDFGITQLFDAQERRDASREKYGIDTPTLMAISPSMRCNLGCYGCYAGAYSKSDDLDSRLLERVVNEARDMGIGFIAAIGGEPFMSQDVLQMWEKNRDFFFLVYTNGTLIDAEMAKRLAEYGNVLPCISVEGYEEETDARRGKGTYARIMAAMDNLRKEGVLFGFSATATRQNNELVSSEEFIDFYVSKGCFIGWYFNYIPIGRKPDVDLMPTPQQRIERWQRVRSLRRSKPILLADFWCDGSLTGGCIAGGRSYFHINNHGDVEPCVFAHFAADNIRDKSLPEALASPFFRAIRSRQPYCSNLLRPCMIIDEPNVLREVVKEGHAHPTHVGAETIITELADDLDQYAARYGEVSDPVWDAYQNKQEEALVVKQKIAITSSVSHER